MEHRESASRSLLRAPAEGVFRANNKTKRVHEISEREGKKNGCLSLLYISRLLALSNVCVCVCVNSIKSVSAVPSTLVAHEILCLSRRPPRSMLLDLHLKTLRFFSLCVFHSFFLPQPIYSWVIGEHIYIHTHSNTVYTHTVSALLLCSELFLK